MEQRRKGEDIKTKKKDGGGHNLSENFHSGDGKPTEAALAELLRERSS